MSASSLIKKIRERTATTGVCGLGYVGLALAVEQARAGFHVIGFDVDASKVEMINAGRSYIKDVSGEDLKSMTEINRLRATSDYAWTADCDCVCIAVPTPLDKHQMPDISYVRASVESIAPYLRPDTLVILESTTYPGTTEELVRPILEQGSGLRCGEDFFLAFSPERVDPGNPVYHTKNTPKVVGGCTPICTEAAVAMYEATLTAPIIKVSSPAVAEMEKILENTYRNVNIALVNELARLCHVMGLSVWEVIDAAKSKPYGFQVFYPGVGVGGHCIPLDPGYLEWKSKEYGFRTTMIEASMAINNEQPAYCAERAIAILNRDQKAVNGAKILILGVAYKKDIGDYRESPAIHMMEILRGFGARVKYYDAWVPEIRGEMFFMESEPVLSEELLKEADLVVISAAHSNIDYSFVSQNAKMIFDAVNVMKNASERKNIEVL